MSCYSLFPWLMQKIYRLRDDCTASPIYMSKLMHVDIKKKLSFNVYVGKGKTHHLTPGRVSEMIQVKIQVNKARYRRPAIYVQQTLNNDKSTRTF